MPNQRVVVTRLSAQRHAIKMKTLALLLVLSVPLCAAANESCTLEELKLSPASPLAERLFYTGTCHYRNKEYQQSVELWKKLLELRTVEPAHTALQVSALNNLGYMLFFGNGIAENKQEAIAYWNKAIGMGHTEAEYHLCHAYADVDVSTYNPVKAIAHCEKAELIYRGMREKGSDDGEILKQIETYLKQLKKNA